MAGERIGKTYEALMKIALDDLYDAGDITGQVFWNETPSGITVEPDFVIGETKDHPSIVIMVTHYGAPQASDKKTWRNLGELCEVKSALSPIPSAYNVVFDAVMKEGLKDLQRSVFDGQLIIDDQTYGTELREWVKTIEKDLPTDQTEKTRVIISRRHTDKQIDRLLRYLELDLKNCLSHQQEEVRQLWELDRTRTRPVAPEAKTTSVRRGTSKLLIFEEVDNAIQLYRGRKISNSVFPAYVYSLGLARKAIGHAKISDEEIKNAVELLSDKQLHLLYNAMHDNDTIQRWILQLRNTSSLSIMVEYIIEHYEDLIQPDKLFLQLKSLHDNPYALIESVDHQMKWPPDTVWLFETILELIKAASGKANSYGYSQLTGDIIAANSPACGMSEEARNYLKSPWGHMSEWSSRSAREDLPDDVLMCVSLVLAKRLSNLGKAGVVVAKEKVIDSFIDTIIELRLCTYRMYEPLYLLLNDQIPGLKKVKYKTCFAEKANLSGASGQTLVAQKRRTIINWQSATDAGKDHKRKELCGRAVGLRYTWDGKKQQFIKRPGVEKLILLLDGTWRQKDIDALIASGWDEIYYPDEIDKLKASIV